MKKNFFISVVLVIGLFILGTVVFAGGTGETAASTSEVKTEYTLEQLLEMAKNREYPGEPAKGKKLAFANISISQVFTQDVQQSIIDEWILAGGSKSDLTILDNNRDTTQTLQNADIVLSKNADAFIEFQNDVEIANIIAKKFGEAGVPIVTIDIPLPTAIFVGQNNWDLSTRTGQWAIGKIDEVYGGWDNVDKIFINIVAKSGGVVALRYKGIIFEFKNAFGDEADPDVEGSKLVLVDCDGTSEGAKESFLNALSAYPDAENIMVFNNNENVTAGAVAAAEISNRFDADKWFIVGQGADSLGRSLIRDGKVDGSMGYFPERYGRTLIPVALALMSGAKVTPEVYVTNLMITPENIAEQYPGGK